MDYATGLKFFIIYYILIFFNLISDISSSDPDSECRSAADSLLLSLREELARDPAIAAIQSLVTGDGDNGGSFEDD